ncbi:MAG TPA: hypothetical protein VE172_02345 [Stackebrandtia sp.]|jgi:protein-S-isoprenylcysteine O-methyltransferase Ste14|uniref:hypothetical protein n=1 Tax=Stackebrandtia sp. TaxID=2023065 RepID=UPI002D6F41B1|nr:hypothetical protein [Stackebrandtia sp.]HZE37627.1 hypothetical protein [Stackebrandtia sp.]
MKSRLRALAKRIRDRARRLSLPKLLVAVAAPVVAVCVVALAIALLFGSALAAATIAGLIATVTLVAVAAMWLTLGRQLRAMRASGERVEVAQRRILAAVELQRLEAEERAASV